MTEKFITPQHIESVPSEGEEVLVTELLTDAEGSTDESQSLPEAPEQIWGSTPKSHMWKPKDKERGFTGWQP